MPPAISIIMPGYRATSHIARAVQSILNQTYTLWELIIISDDGCDYHDILAKHQISDPRIRYLSTGAIGSGSANARNIGMRDARADIITFLDADDIFYPEKLAAMYPYARRYGMCSCALNILHMQGKNPHVAATIGQGDDRILSAETYLSVNYSGSTMLMMNRTAVPIMWSLDAPVLEDIAFAMAAFDYITNAYHIGSPLYGYIYTPNSLSTNQHACAVFLETKQRMLANLETPAYGIHDTKSRRALQQFFTISIRAEYAYQQRRLAGETVSFTEILKSLLAHQAAQR